MAAPLGSQNALGNSGGKSLNDRKLAAKVRTLALGEIADLLEMPKVKMKSDDYELYKAILIKLAGSVLPRLNEHTGEDGEKLFPDELAKAKSAEAIKSYLNGNPANPQ